MSPTLAFVIVFGGIATMVAAAGLFVRDLRTAQAAGPVAPPTRLARLRPTRVEPFAGPSVRSFDAWFEQLLREAGIESNATLVMLLVLLAGIACGAALYVWDERVGPAVVAALVGLGASSAYLGIRRARHVGQLQEQVPPALDALARSIRAGQTMEQAIAMVGAHIPEPLSAEFRWCASQLDMGLGLPAVMHALVRRVRLYDLRIFSTTLIVHRQMGGNVVTVLERLAQVIRERLNYRRQMRATTAAGRTSATIVSLVAPTVFVYFFFFRQDYFQTMFQSSLGQLMLIVAGVLEVVGLIWVWRLLKPSY